MTFDEWTKSVLVAVLENEEETGDFDTNLEAVCKKKGLRADDEWLVRFINEQRAFGHGSGIVGYQFTLDPNGRYYANQIRQERAAKTFFGRLKSINRSDWIALGAFFVSLIALYK